MMYYVVRVKPAKGKAERIGTTATTAEQARRTVAEFMGCPMSITSVVSERPVLES